MKKQMRQIAGLFSICWFAINGQSFAQTALTPGNLVVVYADASANNTTAGIVELNKTGSLQTPIQTILIDGTGVNAIRVSGSATSTMYTSSSKDGSLFTFTGVNLDQPSGNANTLNPRAVVTLNQLGQIAIPATYSANATGQQTRGATTKDNVNWYFADQSGLYMNNATAPSPTGNFRSIRAFGDSVYVFRSTNTTTPVSTLSNYVGGIVSTLPGLPNGNSNMTDFYMVQSGNNGSTYDVLFITEATSNSVGTVYKYSLVDGLWVANGTYTTNFGGFGLAAEKNETSGFNLYITSGSGAQVSNSLFKITDLAGYNEAINIDAQNIVTLFTLTSKILKGVGFAPKQVPTFDAVNPVCQGTDIVLPTQSTNGIAGTWSPAFNNQATTTYTFTPTNQEVASVVTLTVTILELPTVNAGENVAVCEGSPVTLTASGNAVSYVWDNNVMDGQSFTPTATTTYTVTGTDANDCSNTDQVLVTVNTSLVFNPGEDVSVCEGNSVELNATGALNYTWENAVANGGSFVPTQTGYLTVVATDASNCQGIDSILITVLQVPTIEAGENQIVCAGEQVTLNAVSSEGTINWENAVINGGSYTPTESGYIVVSVENNNQCISLDSILITVNVLPNVNAGNDISICSGNSVTLNATGALSYDWEGTIENGVAFTPTATGYFTVEGTDENGCSAIDSVLITILPSPIANAGNNVTICAGQSTVLNASGGTSYVWSNGVQNGSSVSPTQTTTYTVTVAAQNQCTDIDEVTVTVEDCSGLNEFEISVSVYPNPINDGFTILWDNDRDANYTITDLNGKILNFGALSYGSNQVISASWNAGVYFLQISIGEQTQLVRLIK